MLNAACLTEKHNKYQFFGLWFDLIRAQSFKFDVNVSVESYPKMHKIMFHKKIDLIEQERHVYLRTVEKLLSWSKIKIIHSLIFKPELT
jgi:hypothetical protein